MLDQLFGNAVRKKVLNFFLTHVDEAYSRGSLKAIFKKNISEAELNRLVAYGVLEKEWSRPELQNAKPKRKKRRGRKNPKRELVYRTNPSFPLLPELRALVLKSVIFWEKQLVKKIKRLGSLQYLAFLGFFTDTNNTPTDMLIVGRMNKRRLHRVMQRFQNEIHHSIRYTLLSKKEFEYRMDITDRFLYDILENEKIVVINELTGYHE